VPGTNRLAALAAVFDALAHDVADLGAIGTPRGVWAGYHLSGLPTTAAAVVVDYWTGAHRRGRGHGRNADCCFRRPNHVERRWLGERLLACLCDRCLIWICFRGNCLLAKMMFVWAYVGVEYVASEYVALL